MRELRLLVGVSFRQMLHTFATGQGKKKNATAAGAVGLMAFLALYISGLYSWLMGELLEEAGVLEFLLPVMTLLAVAVSLVFTFFAASGIIFSGKDTDLIRDALQDERPLSGEPSVCWPLDDPVGSGWLYLRREKGSPLFPALSALHSVRSLPALPAGFPGGLCGRLGRRQNEASGAVVKSDFHRPVSGADAGMYADQSDRYSFAESPGRGPSPVHDLVFTHRPVGQRNGGKPGGAAGQLDPLRPAFFWRNLAVSIRYQAILSSLQSRLIRNDYRLTKVKEEGPFGAMLKKEIGRLFSTPSYLFNAGVGVVLLLAAGVWMTVMKDQMALLMEVAGHELADPVLLGGMAFLLATVYPTAVSISLEGRTIWLLKEAPLKPSILFGAKICLNLVLAWPATLIFTILAACSLGISAMRAICMALVSLAMTGFLAAAELMVNLHFPKLDWDNDTVVIKQSASAMIACLGSILIVAAAAGLYVLTGRKIGFEVFCLAMAVLFTALGLLVWRKLMRNGPSRFEAL